MTQPTTVAQQEYCSERKRERYKETKFYVVDAHIHDALCILFYFFFMVFLHIKFLFLFFFFKAEECVCVLAVVVCLRMAPNFWNSYDPDKMF